MNQENNTSNNETETNKNWVISDPDDNSEEELTEEELKRIDEEVEYLFKIFEEDDEEVEPLNKKFLHDENKTLFIVEAIEEASNCIDIPYSYRCCYPPMCTIENIFGIYNHQELSQLPCIKKIKDELLNKTKTGDFPCTKIFIDKYYDKC